MGGGWRGIQSDVVSELMLCNETILQLTSRLSSVSKTATPASTLPTVKETSIAFCVCFCGLAGLCRAIGSISERDE